MPCCSACFSCWPVWRWRNATCNAQTDMTRSRCRMMSSRAFLIGLTATLFPFLDIPVFWPILLMYWLVLVGITMRRQIKHMIKYKYLPFDFGKQVCVGCVWHALFRSERLACCGILRPVLARSRKQRMQSHDQKQGK